MKNPEFNSKNKTIEQIESEIRILELHKLSAKINNKKISAQKSKSLMHHKLSLILKFIGSNQNDNAAAIVSKLLDEYPEKVKKRNNKNFLLPADGFGIMETGVVSKDGRVIKNSAKL